MNVNSKVIFFIIFLQEMSKVMGRLRSFRVFVDPGPLVYYPTDSMDKTFSANFRRDVLAPLDVGRGADDAMYFRHMTAFQWDAHGIEKPIMVAMVNPDLLASRIQFHFTVHL